MKDAPRFGTVVTAMVTPFDSDGGLDLDAAVSLARHLAENGSDGLVVAGTTGEGPVLDDPERIALFRAVIEAVTIPVVATSGTNDTAHSIMMTKEAKAAGAAGVLVVTPYYNRPSAAGLSAHFRAVAAATDLPVILYDIPARSARRIGPDLTVQLATEVSNIVAVKDATGDVAAAARVVAEAPAGFELYSGDDSLTLPFASIGGVGVISVASHWAGPVFAQMLAAHGAGVLPVRVVRGVSEPGAGQGRVPSARSRRRSVPSAQCSGPAVARRPGALGHRRVGFSRTVAALSCLTPRGHGKVHHQTVPTRPRAVGVASRKQQEDLRT